MFENVESLNLIDTTVINCLEKFQNLVKLKYTEPHESKKFSLLTDIYSKVNYFETNLEKVVINKENTW